MKNSLEILENILKNLDNKTLWDVEKKIIDQISRNNINNNEEYNKEKYQELLKYENKVLKTIYKDDDSVLSFELYFVEKVEYNGATSPYLSCEVIIVNTNHYCNSSSDELDYKDENMEIFYGLDTINDIYDLKLCGNQKEAKEYFDYLKYMIQNTITMQNLNKVQEL